MSLYEDDSSEKLRPGPATDIAAILTVIARRDVKHLDREKANAWLLDFRGSDLRGSNLSDAHLERANLQGAHLETAKGLVQDQITQASGNSETTLPEGFTRPEHWA